MRRHPPGSPPAAGAVPPADHIATAVGTHLMRAVAAGCPARRRAAGLAIAAALLLPAAESSALGAGEFTLFLQEAVASDDNVLRLPKGVPSGIPGDTRPRGDTYYTTAAGFSVDVPVSRQRFQGGYTWNESRYRRYDEFDFTGHDGNATWLWQAGDDAKGKLAYVDTAAPQSFAGVQERVTDVLHSQQVIATAALAATPRWRVEMGAAGLRQQNRNRVNCP